MIHLFCGYDQREAVGFHTFVASVIANATAPVGIHPLDSKGLPQGTNTFTFSRFLVPWLMRFKGRAIFADACDMVMLGDVAELEALFDPSKAVQCVQHDYKTQHRVKYIGTEMECPNLDYPRKNWASLMLVNCEHPAWAGMTPERVAGYASIPTHLLGLNWIDPVAIGELPNEWNRLVDEGQEVDGAQVLHWTAGIPAFAHYRDAPGADRWRSHFVAVEKAA